MVKKETSSITSEEEEKGIREDQIPRKSLKNVINTSWRATAILTGTSLGIIYGDIGTSPLYVLNAIFPSSGGTPGQEDVIGAVSCIIWAITIVALIKYAIIALEFGTTSTGEGGPFAIYTALYPPREETDDNRVLTSYTTASNSGAAGLTGKDGGRRGSSRGYVGEGFLDKEIVKRVLFGWVLFGTCLTFSDGLLTPAVSVVSAVEGIAVAVPSVEHSVVPISIGILVALFILQALGTQRVGSLFAPIIALWLSTIAISGIINLVAFPGIFRAFDPSRAVMLFVRTGQFDILSGVLLSITGVEAMFANLGQFSKTSIRISFIGYVYPCLIFAYLGQGAKLITEGDRVIENVFFQSIPGGVGSGFWWFTFVLAIMAAIIASQAMISATFSLVQQLTRLEAMPALKIVHTNNQTEGQVFVPSVNIAIMIGTIALTAAFGTDAGLTNAYGFAVSGVLIVTTSILAIAIVRLKHLPVIVAVGFFFISVFFDSLFFGSSLKKIPQGAYVPLAIACIIMSFLAFWSWAKGLENTFDANNRHRLHEVITREHQPDNEEEYISSVIPTREEEIEAGGSVNGSPTSGGLKLPPLIVGGDGMRKRSGMAVNVKTPKYDDNLILVDGNATLVRLPVFALFHNHSANTMNGAPHSFSAFLKSYPSLPQVCIFFNLRIVGVPYTSASEKYIVSRVRSFEGVYIATLRLGYRDVLDLSDVARPIREEIVEIERKSGITEEEVEERIRLIDEALKGSVTHILPHFHITVDQTRGNKYLRWIKTFAIQSIYRRVAVNFNPYDAFEFGESEESVLRMGVAAKI